MTEVRERTRIRGRVGVMERCNRMLAHIAGFGQERQSLCISSDCFLFMNFYVPSISVSVFFV